jgi:hypothetical protein
MSDSAPLVARLHHRKLDPCNALNPGIGMTSRNPGWT